MVRPPLYLVVDHRRDGRVRIIAEYTEPRDALEHAKLLRWAGGAAEILLATRLEEARPADPESEQ